MQRLPGFDIPDARPLGPGHHIRPTPDRGEGADRRVDTAGNRRDRPFEHLIVVGETGADAQGGLAPGGLTARRIAEGYHLNPPAPSANQRVA